MLTPIDGLVIFSLIVNCFSMWDYPIQCNSFTPSCQQHLRNYCHLTLQLQTSDFVEKKIVADTVKVPIKATQTLP